MKREVYLMLDDLEEYNIHAINLLLTKDLTKLQSSSIILLNVLPHHLLMTSASRFLDTKDLFQLFIIYYTEYRL